METISASKSKKPDSREAQRILYHRLVEDQRLAEKYFRGEYTLQQLHAKGIRFFKPI